MIDREFAIQASIVAAVLLLVYVFLVRPQMRRLSENEKLLSSLKTGDMIVTTGGLIGTITAFDGVRVVELELGASMRVRVLRDCIENRFENRSGEVSG